MRNEVAFVRTWFYIINHLKIPCCITIMIIYLIGVTIKTSQVLSPRTDIFFRQWSHGDSILPQDFRRDSLHDLRTNFRINKNLEITVAVRINESRGNNETSHVNDFSAVCRINLTDFYNFIAINQNIRLITVGARAIDNDTIFQQSLHFISSFYSN